MYIYIFKSTIWIDGIKTMLWRVASNNLHILMFKHEDQVGKVDLLPTVREFNFFFIFPFYPCPSFYPPSFLNSPLTHHLQLQTSDPTTPNTTIRNIHFLAENLHCCMRSTTIIFSLLFLLYSLLCQILYVISKSHCHSKDKQQQPLRV